LLFAFFDLPAAVTDGNLGLAWTRAVADCVPSAPPGSAKAAGLGATSGEDDTRAKAPDATWGNKDTARRCCAPVKVAFFSFGEMKYLRG